MGTVPLPHMSFSEKMRESLGAEGVQLDVVPPSNPLVAGATYRGTLHLRGGSRGARVEQLIVRIIEADRYWKDVHGEQIAEADVVERSDRRELRAAWVRRAVGVAQLVINRDVAASQVQSFPLEFHVPSDCRPSSPACSHTLSVQAEIRGQIDPTCNARITIAVHP